MTSTELIEIMKAIDPYGTMDVCIGNVGVTSAYITSPKQDGWYQVVNNMYRGVPKAKYDGEGSRIVFLTSSIEEAFMSHPDMKVDVIGDDNHGYRESMIEEWRSPNVPTNNVKWAEIPAGHPDDGFDDEYGDDDDNDDD